MGLQDPEVHTQKEMISERKGSVECTFIRVSLVKLIINNININKYVLMLTI